MAEFDMAITDGTIIDGTRAPCYRADLGIKNGKEATIGRLSLEETHFRPSRLMAWAACITDRGTLRNVQAG